MRKRNGLIKCVLGLALAAALFAAPAIAGADYKGFKRGDSLITVEELKTLIDNKDPKLVVIAVVKGGLTGSYTRGHIPGAFSVWRPEYEPRSSGAWRGWCLSRWACCCSWGRRNCLTHPSVSRRQGDYVPASFGSVGIVGAGGTGTPLPEPG